MIKRRGRPTQNWTTFLHNHLGEIAAIDFLTVPTVMFRTLYVFVVLSLDRRRIVHINVTYSPSAEWTARQLYQAFPFDSAPRYLVRDRDGIYGDAVVQAIANMGVVEKVTSARSPWQNGYCERVVGSMKRECLNHVIVFGERHAKRVLKGVPGVLPRVANSPRAGEGRARWKAGRVAGSRAGAPSDHGRRAA